jgi:hypothetical protein
MLTLGKIRDDIQADYNNVFNDLRATKRGVTRVLGDLNLVMSGVDTVEDGLELIVAATTESVIFTANNTIEPTTAPSSDILPGDVIVFYDTGYNNNSYLISNISATEFLVAVDYVLTAETISCTYAIYRPLRRAVVSDIRFTKLDFNNTAHTITSTTPVVDFLAMGIKAGDLIAISGQAQDLNNSMFIVDSLIQAVITIKTLGTYGKMTDSIDTPATMSVYSPDPTYAYDLENHRITVTPMAKELRDITFNETGIVPKSFPTIKHDDYDESDVYAMDGRLAAILGDEVFIAAADILKFHIISDLDNPTAAYQDLEIDVPKRYEHTLFLGVLAFVLSLPRYRSDNIKEYVAEYKTALAILTKTEETVNPDSDFNFEYKY